MAPRALSAVAFLLVAAVAWGQQYELVDRVLAVVDEDPVLLSEVEQVLVLGLVEPREGEDERQLRRRVLDLLIEQRLRFHEIDAFGFVEIPEVEIQTSFDEIRARFGTDEAFDRDLERVGLDRDSLRQLIARQLMVLYYVNERLGPRIFVDLDDIRAYYEGTLVPELQRRGASVPPIQDVREDIRALLKEQRLDEELVRWTDELRSEADVEDYFGELPGTIPERRVGGSG